MSKDTDIKEFWRDRGEKYGSSCKATLRETTVRYAEIRILKKYLRDGQEIVDIGCGNGFSTIQWAKSIKSDFLGIDCVPEMIDLAHNEFERDKLSLRGRLEFQIADVTRLELNRTSFDIAITERCLQNLTCFTEQLNAIKSICGILKNEGLFLMLECSKTAVDKINNFLKKMRRHPIHPIPWHNIFFEDEILIQNVEAKTKLRLMKIDNFASNYIFTTRVLPSLAQKMLFKFRLGEALWKLPQIGNWGYFKLYVWRKTF